MIKMVKRAVVFMMVFSVLLGSLPSFGGFFVKAAGSDVIRNDETGIPDKALYQMILIALAKTPDSTFTEEEAQKVQELSQDVISEDDRDRKEEEQVVSLQGIEKLTNLRSFHLGRNKITDLKPLESLKNLRLLDLCYPNRITSIEGLRNCTQLKYLYLQLSSAATDLSPIEGMTELVGLCVMYAGISTLPDLTRHTNLNAYYTYLRGNNLTKKELTTKLPKQLVENKVWLKTTFDLQEYNVKKMKKTLKVTSPKKVTKITSKTKKIIGKAAKNKNVYVELYYGSGDPGRGRPIAWSKADKNGVFKMKKLNLKKYKKKKLFLVLYYDPISWFYDDPYVIKTIAFKLKK